MRIIPCPKHLMDDVRESFAEFHPGEPFPHLPGGTVETLVALDDRHPYFLGYTMYALQGPALILIDTGVVPDARGRGIARAFLQERLDRGRMLGAAYACCGMQPQNTSMLKLLTEFKFEETAPMLGQRVFLLPLEK